MSDDRHTLGELYGITPQPWADLALCAQTDPDLFFPEKGGTTAAARRVCRACEVRTDCLEWALENGERYGIWGGLSERQRRKITNSPPQRKDPAA